MLSYHDIVSLVRADFAVPQRRGFRFDDATASLFSYLIIHSAAVDTFKCLLPLTSYICLRLSVVAVCMRVSRRVRFVLPFALMM